jgi:DNA-binding transcriptional ArsR family regulator
MPILRSRHLAERLTLLLLHPDSEYTLSELAAKLSLPLSTAQREADRLVGSGLIRERRVGRARLVAAGHVERVQGAQADGASWLDRARRGLGAARH